ncbi:MAG: S41 family peptidase [Defluviitaleaceae bacterium]|nr:S41 family peptidase [Defluviitaleaceae bacterium]
MMKKYIAVIVFILFLLAFPADVFAGASNLIPIREFFESEGGEVFWCEDERLIIVYYNGGHITIPAEGTDAVVNRYPIELQSEVVIYEGRAYLNIFDFLSLLVAAIDIQVVSFSLTEEARDIVLYDFDYMVNVTLENAVWDNIIYRRLGIDFDEHVAFYREFIEEKNTFEAFYMPEHLPVRGGDDPLDMAADYLSHLLLHMFTAPFEGIGHLAPREMTMYRMMLTSLLRAYAHQEQHTSADIELIRSIKDVYTHPQAIWFYGEYEVDIYEESGAFPIIPGNVVTEIIEDGKIAYMRIQSFLSDLDYDDAIIFPFLHEIKDFENLVIDIRGNTGGSVMYFNALILMRILRENKIVQSHQFFTGGEEAKKVMQRYHDMLESFGEDSFWMEFSRLEIMQTADFVYEMGGMPYFNQDDKARLVYVLVIEETLFPYRLPQFARVDFGGKLWLLVDEMSMSASVNAALAVMATGMGTVVGENTSGVTGPEATYIMLPNTGIIWRLDIGHLTDNYGRSLEEFGVTPHIHNYEGMDALETVLYIIQKKENGR